MMVIVSFLGMVVCRVSSGVAVANCLPASVEQSSHEVVLDVKSINNLLHSSQLERTYLLETAAVLVLQRHHLHNRDSETNAIHNG